MLIFFNGNCLNYYNKLFILLVLKKAIIIAMEYFDDFNFLERKHAIKYILNIYNIDKHIVQRDIKQRSSNKICFR